MNTRYYVSIFSNAEGKNLIHTETCLLLPDMRTRINLGIFENSDEAFEAASANYSNSDFCNECLTKIRDIVV